MSDPVTSARAARERLAQGLAALQTPGVPAALLGVAEPVAQAMSSLHQIEASQGAARAQAAPAALDAVRRALGALHGDTSQHPAVVRAVEAVASSLGLVHGLTVAPAPVPAAPPQPPAQNLALAGTLVAEQAHVPATQASPHVHAAAGHPAPHAAQAQQWAAPAAAPPAFPQQAPPAFPQQAAHAPAYAPPAPAAAAPMAAGGLLRVAAELGVHSVTNFYKGLSGNDIIESGGIFIATYQIPQMGRQLLIHVTMPGGYEFEAKGVVRWTREAPLSSASGLEAPPGFGAQFTEITPEAKQLVYRYVRNREPLFHDDL